MAKEVAKDNSFGVASVILGILSIVFASLSGIIFAIISLVFASKQAKLQYNKWSKTGKILAIIGIILSIIVLIAQIYLIKNPGLLNQALLQAAQ